MNRQQRYDLRRALHDLFDGRCAYCCEPTPMPVGTIDHYLPKALGGTWHPKNLRWCCFPCNNLKSSMHPDKWEAVKPAPKQRPETRHQRRTRLLSLCVPRASLRTEKGAN